MTDTNYDSTNYIERDISWVYFNHRILQEAQQENVPLLDRLSFLGIYSSNLDEFYRVRMATLARMGAMEGKDMAKDASRAATLFEKISKLNAHISEEYESCIQTITDRLAQEGIYIINETELDAEQAHFVKSLFRRQISGFVSPVWLSEIEGLSPRSDSHIYLAVEMKGKGKTDYAVLSLPSEACGRFITLPIRDDGQYVMYLDDAIRFALPMIFPGMGFDSFKAYSFKFTKDAELDIDNDVHASPLQKIERAVKRRKKGNAVRLQYDAEMPAGLLQAIKEKLKLSSIDTVQPTGRYQNHKDLIKFPSIGKPDLKYPEWKTAVPNELRGSDSLISFIEERDRMVHVPYQTFDYVIRLLQEAAISKRVKSIKITLYRLARHSKIIEALKCAARNGKKVTAVVELMARFDEKNNIHYANEMEEAGINVIFGMEGLKIHSKIIHIGMKDGHDIAVIGTGNFHEGNASLYTDYFMMTADPKTVSEVSKVFRLIRHPLEKQDFHRLLVSPLSMRTHFLHLIDNEIADAKRGVPAWIKIKINHITDPVMIDKLYEASQAGVKIDLLVRGNCSLRTGVPGMSENIKAIGIIDRYLEHSRIFIFHAGGKEKTYIGSADWMPRNLDRRIEVVAKVTDPLLKADLRRTVEYGLRDNVKGRIVDGSGRNLIQTSSDCHELFRSQEKLYDAYQRSEEKENK